MSESADTKQTKLNQKTHSSSNQQPDPRLIQAQINNLSSLLTTRVEEVSDTISDASGQVEEETELYHEASKAEEVTESDEA